MPLLVLLPPLRILHVDKVVVGRDGDATASNGRVWHAYGIFCTATSVTGAVGRCHMQTWRESLYC